MSRWLATVALLGCWGCAFSLDGPDPNRPRARVPRCDTSKGLVALDGVMATTFGVGALALASEGEAAAALIPLGISVLYLGGAIAGNRAVDACKKAIDDYEGSYPGERFAARDEDEDDDEEPRARGKRLIPRPREAGQPAQPTGVPQPAPYQTPYPRASAPNAPVYPPPPQPRPPVASPQPPASAGQPARVEQPGREVPASEATGDDWSAFWREVP